MMRLIANGLLSAITISAFVPNNSPLVCETELRSHALSGYSPGAVPLPSFSSIRTASCNNSPLQQQIQSASAVAPPAAAGPVFSGFGHAITALGPNNSPFKERIPIQKSLAIVPIAFYNKDDKTQTISASAPAAALKPAGSTTMKEQQGSWLLVPNTSSSLCKETTTPIKESVAVVPVATVLTGFDHESCSDSSQTASCAAPAAASKPAVVSFSDFQQAYEIPTDPNPPLFSTQTVATSAVAATPPFALKSSSLSSFTATQAYEPSDPNPPEFSFLI